LSEGGWWGRIIPERNLKLGGITLCELRHIPGVFLTPVPRQGFGRREPTRTLAGALAKARALARSRVLFRIPQAEVLGARDPKHLNRIGYDACAHACAVGVSDARALEPQTT